MADWFDQNWPSGAEPGGITGPQTWRIAPTTATGDASSSAQPLIQTFGNSMWDRIGQIFRNVGVTPTQQLVSQWGNNIDENYFSKIAQQIVQSYGQQANAAPAPSAPSSSLGMFTKGMSDDQVRSLYHQWVTATGAKDTDNGDYWIQQYHQYGNSDPAYFGTRLANGLVQDGGGNADALKGVQGLNFGQGTAGGPGSTDNPANNGVTPFSYKPFDDTFSYADYQPTTQAEVEADPGFKERLNLGLDTIQHSAAAKGSILSGQTLNDLNQYAQGYASNETAAVDARRRADYATNYGNALQQFQQKWAQYQQGWQNAFTSWGANANLAQTNWQNAYSLANQQFGFNQQNWQNQYSLASLGLQAALGAANAGGNYANSAGNLITGAGNAQAAGTVGSGNAWGGAFGNLASYGMAYPYLTNTSIYGNRGNVTENTTTP